MSWAFSRSSHGQVESFPLNAKREVRKSYNLNTGPLRVVSSGQPIVSTVRHLYSTPAFASLYEMMGLPGSQLSIRYFFPWYNNTAMRSELRFALP